MPLGPRSHLRPVPVTMSAVRQVSGTWPADWHASSSTSAPTSCAAATTSSTGFTRPPLVGTCTSDTIFTRSSIRRRSASTSTAPCASEGTGSTLAPTSAARRSSGIALPAYSTSVTRTRSPSASGIESNAASQARVALSVNATSSGSQPSAVASTA